MAHFEQAALLATAWANNAEVKQRALHHSIMEVSNSKKLKRGRFLRIFVKQFYHVVVAGCIALKPPR